MPERSGAAPQGFGASLVAVLVLTVCLATMVNSFLFGLDRIRAMAVVYRNSLRFLASSADDALDARRMPPPPFATDIGLDAVIYSTMESLYFRPGAYEELRVAIVVAALAASSALLASFAYSWAQVRSPPRAPPPQGRVRLAAPRGRAPPSLLLPLPMSLLYTTNHGAAHQRVRPALTARSAGGAADLPLVPADHDVPARTPGSGRPPFPRTNRTSLVPPPY